MWGGARVDADIIKMGKKIMQELRVLKRDALLERLEKYKNELAQLRVSKVTGGAASKLAKIKVVRRSIARTLTVFNQTQKSELRKQCAGNKFLPLDLRVKKTRAIRRRLSKDELSKKTLRQAKKDMHFPCRKYAVMASS